MADFGKIDLHRNPVPSVPSHIYLDWLWLAHQVFCANRRFNTKDWAYPPPCGFNFLAKPFRLK
jgi:hypothetical protein